MKGELCVCKKSCTGSKGRVLEGGDTVQAEEGGTHIASSEEAMRIHYKDTHAQSTSLSCVFLLLFMSMLIAISKLPG